MSTGRTSDGGSVLSGHVPKPGLLVGGRAFVCGGVPARTPTDRCPPREEGGGGDNDPELKTTPKDEKPAIGGGPRQAFLKRLPRSKPSRTTLYRSTYKIHPPGRQGPDVKVRRLPPRRRPGLRRNGYYIPCFIFTHNRWRDPAPARFSALSAPRVGLVGRTPLPPRRGGIIGTNMGRPPGTAPQTPTSGPRSKTKAQAPPTRGSRALKKCEGEGVAPSDGTRPFGCALHGLSNPYSSGYSPCGRGPCGSPSGAPTRLPRRRRPGA